MNKALQCLILGLVIALFFRFRSSLDHKRWSRKRNGKKWKHSDSSESDSVELMTPLMTAIFDFHLVVSSLTTLSSTAPTTTPSVVKTSLKRPMVDAIYLGWSGGGGTPM